MGIVLPARPDGNFPLGRMKQKLYIADIGELSHTEQIEGYFIIRYRYRGPFVAHLRELVPYHLISFQIEGA